MKLSTVKVYKINKRRIIGKKSMQGIFGFNNLASISFKKQEMVIIKISTVVNFKDERQSCEQEKDFYWLAMLHFLTGVAVTQMYSLKLQSNRLIQTQHFSVHVCRETTEFTIQTFKSEERYYQLLYEKNKSKLGLPRENAHIWSP